MLASLGTTIAAIIIIIIIIIIHLYATYLQLIAKTIHTSRVSNIAATLCFKFVVTTNTPRSHDRLYGEVNSVKKHNRKIWLKLVFISKENYMFRPRATIFRFRQFSAKSVLYNMTRHII